MSNKPKKLVLRSKPLIRQRPVARGLHDNTIQDLCERLDYVVKRSESIEAQLNNIEMRKSQSSYNTKDLTFGTPSVLKLNTTASPMRKTEISMSVMDNAQNSYIYQSPIRQNFQNSTPTLADVLNELNELKKDVKSVVEVQRELRNEIMELKRKK